MDVDETFASDGLMGEGDKERCPGSAKLRKAKLGIGQNCVCKILFPAFNQK